MTAFSCIRKFELWLKAPNKGVKTVILSQLILMLIGKGSSMSPPLLNLNLTLYHWSMISNRVWWRSLSYIGKCVSTSSVLLGNPIFTTIRNRVWIRPTEGKSCFIKSSESGQGLIAILTAFAFILRILLRSKFGSQSLLVSIRPNVSPRRGFEKTFYKYLGISIAAWVQPSLFTRNFPFRGWCTFQCWKCSINYFPWCKIFMIKGFYMTSPQQKKLSQLIWSYKTTQALYDGTALFEW